MLKMNKKVEYALMCLKFMAQKSQDELTSAREVCDVFKTPFDPMAKVMQTLNTHQILCSVKGTKGGYRLARPLSTVSFWELTQVIEGERPESYCFSHKGRCELYGSCNIINPVEQLNRKLAQFLNHLTLDELLMSGLKSPEATLLENSL